MGDHGDWVRDCAHAWFGDWLCAVFGGLLLDSFAARLMLFRECNVCG
jgi:hypothetical protein